MKDLLKRIDDAGILLDVVDEQLKLFAEKEEIDADLLNEIRTRKIEIRDYLVQNNIVSIYETEYKAIPKAPESRSYPLSDAQRRLWVLNQFENESGVYNMPSTVALHGEYDIESLNKAVTAVIHRHEILRTVFKKDEEQESSEIRQWILNVEELGFQIEYLDFTEGDSSTTPDEVKQVHQRAFEWVREDTIKAFDLESGPLIRAALLRIDAGEHLFYYNMHHIISDGWSLQILIDEVFKFYEAFVENRVPEIDELPIQYKDYAEWQLNEINTDTFLKQKNYWLNKLSGDLPIIDLPTSKKRPQFKTYSGSAMSTFIDTEITEGLNQYVKEEGGSLFMILLAGWNVAVSQYSGEQDIIIGTPVAGREHADLNNQIGFFVNMLPLRNQVNPSDTLGQLYEKVKKNTLAGFENQMYPFDRLVEDLALIHRTDRTAVFDVLFALQNQSNTSSNDSEEFSLSKEDAERMIDRGDTAAKFDLEISLEEKGKYLELKVIFNSDVYESKTIRRLIEQFKKVLQKITSDPSSLIQDISALSHDEKQEQQLVFNQTKKEFLPFETLLNAFAQQVEENSGHTALVVPKYDLDSTKNTDSVNLTFAELDQKSNQLANFLLEKYALKKGDLVGLKLERDEWMIISILAVLKTGAAYLPIDPEYPENRIEYILGDANCSVLIDSNELTAFEEKDCSAVLPAVSIESNDLAYVIYTSGSTGNPKGVMISHGAILNTLFAQMDIFDLDSEAVGLQFASFSFDASISEIFITLLSGGTLVVANDVCRKDPELLIDLIEKHGVNLATLPPTYLSKIDEEKLKGVKKLITAGETADYSRAIAQLEYGNYYNAYGPTETAICATIFALTKEEALKVNHLPIGKPIANTEIFILNQQQELLPSGAMGEICIGGKGLAMGYLNRPELTAEKFVQHPFDSSKKIYRTGDLGKWLPDGNVEFLGRKDDQVKVRGYRVELGEIEHALRKNDQIEQAIVLAKRNKENQNELVAYLTAKSEQDAASIRSEVKKHLPDYMVPSHFIQLEEFFLTANGKIDKSALPDPEGLEMSSGTAYVAPRNEIEEKMVELWQMVLNRTRVGVYDDFHELGGYSVKAIGLVAEYNKTFNVRLTLQEIYQRTKLYEHAELVEIRTWVNESKDQDDEPKENIETFEF
ncbi:MAG: amino acid adenylation domain-containing protein [Crocinitomicaceae bacterium]